LFSLCSGVGVVFFGDHSRLHLDGDECTHTGEHQRNGEQDEQTVKPSNVETNNDSSDRHGCGEQENMNLGSSSLLESGKFFSVVGSELFWIFDIEPSDLLLQDLLEVEFL
jgi:hypothetical protein